MYHDNKEPLIHTVNCNSVVDNLSRVNLTYNEISSVVQEIKSFSKIISPDVFNRIRISYNEIIEDLKKFKIILEARALISFGQDETAIYITWRKINDCLNCLTKIKELKKNSEQFLWKENANALERKATRLNSLIKNLQANLGYFGATKQLALNGLKLDDIVRINNDVGKVFIRKITSFPIKEEKFFEIDLNSHTDSFSRQNNLINFKDIGLAIPSCRDRFEQFQCSSFPSTLHVKENLMLPVVKRTDRQIKDDPNKALNEVKGKGFKLPVISQVHQKHGRRIEAEQRSISLDRKKIARTLKDLESDVSRLKIALNLDDDEILKRDKTFTFPLVNSEQ